MRDMINKRDKMEVRSVDVSGLKLREAEGNEDSRVIEGYAIRFNEKSVVICSWGEGYFREIIAPEACTKEFLDKQDILLTMYHNDDIILGRSINGEGTLSYEVDDKGVLMRCELPKTMYGDEAREHVRLRNLRGMSFAFIDGQNAGAIEWSEDEDGIPVRTVREMYGVYDMTIARKPAYPTTHVAQRDAEMGINGDCSEMDGDEVKDEGGIAADNTGIEGNEGNAGDVSPLDAVKEREDDEDKALKEAAEKAQRERRLRLLLMNI